MQIVRLKAEGKEFAQIVSNEVVVSNEQSALDLIATVSYCEGLDSIIIDKQAISEDFFDLKTTIAGGVLQKFINYQMRLAIVGDFSMYPSKSLKDFIYESNKVGHICFVDSVEQAVGMLKG